MYAVAVQTTGQEHPILYSYFMPVCSIVQTTTPGCRGRPDALIARGRRPSALVHQVVHGTEV